MKNKNPIITNDLIDYLYSVAETEADVEKMKEFGFVKNAFESRAGVLTFAERKSNLASIERGFDAYQASLLATITILVGNAKTAFLKKVEELIKAGKIEDLKKIAFELNGEVAAKYAETMKNMFELGKKTASEEMGVPIPPTDKEIAGLYRGQANALETKIATDLTSVGMSEVFYNLLKGVAVALVIEQASKAIDQKSGKIIIASATAGIGQAFNGGRIVVYERHKELIYGFQYTAVLDTRTTNLCRSLNGRVVGVGEADFFLLSPPNHTNCRSFWVEILEREFYKPDFEPIPDYISRKNTGYTNFLDLKKAIPYEPKGTLTKDEELIQREGIISDLRSKGVKIKEQ